MHEAGRRAGSLRRWESLSQWLAADHGQDGSQERRGRPAKLAGEHLRLIPDLLSHGAEVWGFRGEVWTCARVAAVIREEFGVLYSSSQVSRLLKALEWTPQQPIERASQRDEAVIEAWRAERWPELKKGWRKRLAHSVHRRKRLLPAAGQKAHLRPTRPHARSSCPL